MDLCFTFLLVMLMSVDNAAETHLWTQLTFCFLHHWGAVADKYLQYKYQL